MDTNFVHRIKVKESLVNPVPRKLGRLSLLTDGEEEDLFKAVMKMRKDGHHVNVKIFLNLAMELTGFPFTTGFFEHFTRRHRLSLHTPNVLPPPAANVKRPDEAYQDGVNCLAEYHHTAQEYQIPPSHRIFFDEMKIEWDFQRTKTIDQVGQTRAHVQGIASLLLRYSVQPLIIIFN